MPFPLERRNFLEFYVAGWNSKWAEARGEDGIIIAENLPTVDP